MKSIVDKTSRDVESKVADVADRFIDDVKNGRSPSIEQYARRHPEIAEIIRQVFPALAVLDTSQPAVESATSEDDHVTGVLGDFRIQREIGRGGMGVVYEATQISLGRSVALKILPFAAMLDRRQLERFKNESRAAATLDHPGIVSVYSVGTDRGVHYYAMQLIEGQTLDQAIHELQQFTGVGVEPKYADKLSQSTSDLATGRFVRSDQHPDGDRVVDETKVAIRSTDTRPFQAASSGPSSTSRPEFFRSVASLGIQAAEALDHAHQRGVLHRDIKPSNLMLDADGKLWVTDFGLARIEADAGMTMTGDLLGTLRYMSPEQALAKRIVIDQRADIYSLGATLYELLTLRPALEGADREEVMRKIAFEEPRPPRRINPSIPADMEIIIAKAMRKNPAERYETAGELADDLTRFLNDEPIRAKPPTLVERAAKWTRRHRGIARTATAALVFATIGLAVSTALVAQQRQVAITQAQRADVEARRAEDEARRAEVNFQAARAAVDRMLTKAAEELADVPHAQQVRRALLEDALEFYQQFLDQKGDRPEIQYETALAYRRVGEIHMAMGNRKEASQAYRRAIEMLEKLNSDSPSEIKYRVILAATLHELTETTLWTSDHDEDLRLRRRKLAVAEQMARDFPDDPPSREQLAYAQTSLANGLKLAGQKRESITLFRAAVTTWQELYEAFPDQPLNQNGMADSHHWLGAALIETGHLIEGERELRQALVLREQLLEAAPTASERRFNMVTITAWIGKAQSKQRKFDEAEEQFRRAIEINRELLDEFPQRVIYQYRFAAVHDDLRHALFVRGRVEEAREVLRTAILHQEKLIEAEPGVAEHVFRLATWNYGLGLSLYAQDEADSEAAKAFRRSLEVWEQFATQQEDDPRSQDELAWFLASCPARQFQDGPRAVQIEKEVLQNTPGEFGSWVTLGAAHYHAGDWKDAIAAIEQARKLPVEEDAFDVYEIYGLFILAMSHWQLDDKPEASRWHEKAAALMDRRLDEETGMTQILVGRTILREAEALMGAPEERDENEDIQ